MSENKYGVWVAVIMIIAIIGQAVSYMAADHIIARILDHEQKTVYISLSQNEVMQEVTETAQIKPNTTAVKEIIVDEIEAEYEAARDAFQPTGVLNPASGVNYFNGVKETYYNLPMDLVVTYAKNAGAEGEYWVREDGCKMLGDYIMVAAAYNVRPYLSTGECSLGKYIVVDTGGFALTNPNQIDIAVNW